MSTGAPQSASTVGEGAVGMTLYAEAPTVDLQASTEDGQGAYDFSPFPTATLEAAYGLTDNLDLELALDGVLYVLLPLPLGGSIGLRQQVVDTEKIAVALSAKIGYVQLGEEVDETELRHEYGATYGKANAVAQFNPRGTLRPGLALTLAPAHVSIDRADEAAESFEARSATLSANLSIAFGNFEFGPFFNLVYFDSERLKETGFYTGGFMLAFRPQKHAQGASSTSLASSTPSSGN